MRLATLIPLCILVVSFCKGEVSEQPNILLIISDDLRDHVGCYGNEVVRTPHIDRLSARGVRFDRAYVQYSVCNPSRSSFLSGLRPDQNGVTDNNTILRQSLPDVVTFPQLLRENGWYAAAFGKIFHLGGGQNEVLQARWMDLPKSWDEAHAIAATSPGKLIAGRNMSGGALAWCEWGMAEDTDDEQPDSQIAKKAIELMENLQDRPWLIAVGFHRPHDPFIAPRKYFDLYPLDSLTLYRDPADITPAPTQAVGFGAYGRAFHNFSDDDRREFLRAYYAGVSFMDAQTGRVLDALDRLKLRDRTVVIFISDHGYHLGERDWWNKHTLFERSCRTPMIIAAPGIEPGVACGLVEFVDLYPTIADLCDLTAPPGIAGTSLRPLLRDPSRPGKRAAYTLVVRGPNGRGDSVRTDRWRFTQWSDGARELYDHEVDPEETNNVADRTEHARLIEDLGELILHHQSQGVTRDVPAEQR